MNLKERLENFKKEFEFFDNRLREILNYERNCIDNLNYKAGKMVIPRNNFDGDFFDEYELLMTRHCDVFSETLFLISTQDGSCHQIDNETFLSENWKEIVEDRVNKWFTYFQQFGESPVL